MALSARMAWEVRTTGSDTANSGGYRSISAVNVAPSIPTVATASSGGSVAANTYYVVVTYTDPYGDTAISPARSVTTTGAASTITVTSPSAASVTYNSQTIAASSWNCYVGTNANGPFFPQGTGLTIGSNRSITTTPPTSGTQPLGGSDYSQQPSAQVTVDGSTITGTVQATTTQLKLTGHTVTAAEVGNTYISTGGTATAALYEIIGIVGTDTWLMDKSLGTNNQTSVGAMGGCFASPGKAAGVRVVGNVIWIQSGTYTLSTSSNVSGGFLIIAGTEPATLPGSGKLVGYGSVRGDLGTKPILQANANSTVLVNPTGTGLTIDNLELRPNGFTSCEGVRYSSVNTIMRRLYCNGTLSYGLRGVAATGCFIMDCQFTNCGQAVSAGNDIVMRCYSDGGGSASGNINVAGGGVAIDCVVANTTTGIGTQIGQSGGLFVNCSVYNATGSIASSGFAASSTKGFYVNCLAVNCAGEGFAGSSTSGGFTTAMNCAAYNCLRNFTLQQLVLENFVSLTVDPFTNAAGGDFSLNKTAGGGAPCREGGVPGVFPGGLTTGYRDIGASEASVVAASHVGLGNKGIRSGGRM